MTTKKIIRGTQMKSIFSILAGGSLAFALCTGSAFAQDDDDGAAAVELYACSYLDGMGPGDLDKVIDKWNDWADDRDTQNYTAWKLTPIFSGTNQEFDVLWLGVTATGAGMGAALDEWYAGGGDVAAEFANTVSCNQHMLFAAEEYRAPPERENPSQVVLSFSDCSIGDGKSYAMDVAPSLSGWAEFRDSHESSAGIWALWPAFGGGGEDFDFKYVTSHGSLEELGADFDNWDGATADELFPIGLLDCDSSRVYHAQRLRAAED
jgi:hypothetical protein